MVTYTVCFGTSGYRGIIDEQFSAMHVLAIARSIVSLLKEQTPQPILVIGCDPRQGNSLTLEPSSFTQILVDTLIEYNCQLYMFQQYIPTPVLAWFISYLNAHGGLMLTASHNPANYNGIKFNSRNGAPAPMSITTTIQKEASRLLDSHSLVAHPPSSHRENLHYISSINPFIEHLTQLMRTWFGELNLKGLKVVIDAKHGTATSVWQQLKEACHISELHLLHKEPRADFNHIQTNPTDEQGLTALKEQAIEHHSIGIAHDLDADRFALVDEHGHLLSTEETMCMIVNYLLSEHQLVHGIITSVASSSIIRLFCEHKRLSYIQTEVGFKYIAQELERAKQQQRLYFGVESSGGASFSLHTLEKCGFFPPLCILYIMAKRGIRLATLKDEFYQQYSPRFFIERSYPFDKHKTDAIKQAIRAFKITSWHSPITTTLEQDQGLKMDFKDGSSLLMRVSGTESVIRCYADASDKKNSEDLIHLAKSFLDDIK